MAKPRPCAMRAMVATACAVAVMAVLQAPTAATMNCAVFSSCADCACRTEGYTVSKDCKRGCVWLPASDQCVSSAQANEAHSEAYLTLWQGDVDLETRTERVAFVAKGLTTCKVEIRTNKILTVSFFFVATLLMWVSSCYPVYKRLRASNDGKPDERAWILERLRTHIMAGDKIVWSDVLYDVQVA